MLNVFAVNPDWQVFPRKPQDFGAVLLRQGYDTKTMRKVVRLRKIDKHARDEAAALLEMYCSALGMQGSFDL